MVDCRACGISFQPEADFQEWCSYQCLVESGVIDNSPITPDEEEWVRRVWEGYERDLSNEVYGLSLPELQREHEPS